MTAEEIRASESGEANFGNESAYWLREIAAQLAELNETLKNPPTSQCRKESQARGNTPRKQDVASPWG